MPKRLATLAALIGAALSLMAALPLAPAAADEPWWQILDGSRPSHLWIPTDNVQEIETEMTEAFGLEGVAARIEIDGDVVGCLGTDNFAGTEVCASAGFAPTTTAPQLQALLEGVFGAGDVEVTGGPVAGDPFLVTIRNQGAAPTIGVVPIEYFGAKFGKVETTLIAAGGSGRLLLTVTNIGDAPVDATETPVTVVDELPAGVLATGFEAVGGTQGKAGPVECSIEASDLVSCSFEGTLRPYEAIEIEIFATLTGDPPLAGAPGKVTVSGGNAPFATAVQEIEVSPEKTPFGIERFFARTEEEGGGEPTQAGSHPFQMSATFQFNAGPMTPAVKRRDSVVEQPAQPRNVRFTLPVGLVGNPTQVPTCEMAKFYSDLVTNDCPDDTAVGVSVVTIVESNLFGFLRVAVPVFNLPPTPGEPARFGFMVGGAPVLIGTEVDPENEYRLIATVSNATQGAQILSSTVVIWGSPGDPRHDDSRGWNCVYFEADAPCERPPNLKESAFLREPVSCKAARVFSGEVEPWNTPLGSVVSSASASSSAPNGCNLVPFDPAIAAAPTSKLAESSTGLSFELAMPNDGLSSPKAIAESQPKKVEVTLPEGMTINPSAAEGLAVCTPADYARERFDSAPGHGCPEASKLGSVQVQTPLLEETLTGALYQAAPHDNPTNSLLGLYIVARSPERGVLVKLAGKVEPDPETGQLVTTFDDAPQLPFSSFKLSFREGGRAPLVTPPACGTYDVVARFVPWSASDPDNPLPEEIVTRTSSFTVQRGVDGGACPQGAAPPFTPGFEAGSLNNAAGRYSPFYMRLTRRDGDQGLTKFSARLPEGALAKLAGVTRCPQASVEAAKGRDGLDEKASPSCPASSRIGHTTVGAGVGSILTYVPGELYLGGPYKGAPLSVVSITPAVAGPFDVGTVVVQEALRLDPRTGEVNVDGDSSDPIPHILAGIPLKVRDLRVYVDRSQFTLTPTSCEPMATVARLFSSGLNLFSAADDVPALLSSRYQAADCASLGFKPRLKIHLASKRSTRGAFPRVRGLYRPRAGDANAEDISVVLPGSQLLENAHFRTICTRVQFAANGGLGGGCPKGAVYGKVKAWTPLLEEPLSGPVYLRSSNNELPDMVAVLKGLVDIESAARIDSVGGRIRVTFEDVPDAPLTKVLLNMQGGRKGLLVNATDVCKGVHRARARLVGHNGKRHVARPKVTARCRGKKRR
jgi:hypothetical protein